MFILKGRHQIISISNNIHDRPFIHISSSDQVIDDTDYSDATKHLVHWSAGFNQNTKSIDTYCYSPVHRRCGDICKCWEHGNDDGIGSIQHAVSVEWDAKPSQRPARRRQWFAKESSPQNACYTQAVGRIRSSVEETEDAVEGCRASKVEEGRELHTLSACVCRIVEA